MKAILGFLCLYLAACGMPAIAAEGIVKTGVRQSHFSAKPVALRLRSSAVLVLAQDSGEPLFAKNIDQIMPIASITKRMTAMVVLDSCLPLLESIDIDKTDVDRKKGSRSKLKVGATLMRAEMLKLALMASDNRAAAALARNFPGGTEAFIASMNQKAAQLGMVNSHFEDPTGLAPDNVSTPEDLPKMVAAANTYPALP